MLLEPSGVAPAWMRERQKLGRVVAPGGDGLGHGRLAAILEIERLRVGADEQRQANVAEQRAQFRMPRRCALLARRLVTAVLVAARIAEAHSHDRDAAFVVEGVAVKAKPFAQS